MALALLPQHDRNERTDPVNHPHEIDGQHPIPVVQSGLPARHTRLGNAHAGVVANHVNSTEGLQGLESECFHLLGLRHVGLHTQDLGARALKLLGCAGERPWLHICEDQLHSCACERLRNPPANTAGGAGDDRDAIRELPHR